MPKRSLLILGGLVIAIAAIALTAGMLIAWSRPTRQVVWQSCQPDTISYDSYDPYCLAVVEGDVNWTFMPLTVMRHHFLFVGRGTEIGYGHYVDYSPQFSAYDKAEYLAGVQLDWTVEGVTFIEPSGHRLFVPADMFTGGR